MPLVTTHAGLLEIGNALARDFRAEAAAVIKLLRRADRVEVITIDKRLFERGLEIYEKYGDKTGGLVDCISFVVMQENGLTGVLTFDGDFTQAGFTAVSS